MWAHFAALRATIPDLPRLYSRILAWNYRMSKAAARTGIMPMSLVAVEQHFPKEQRVIDDVLAARLLPLGAGEIEHRCGRSFSTS